MNKKKKPLYIVFEGIDGSGKDTQIDLLAQWFDKDGQDFMVNAQPHSGNPIGKVMRNFLAGRYDNWVTKEIKEAVIAHLATAEGLLHKTEIENRDYNIIQSRSFVSTMAYNYMPGVRDSFDYLYKMTRILPRPDLIVYLDITVETAMGRLKTRGGEIENYENELNLRRARANYYSIWHTPYRYNLSPNWLRISCDDLPSTVIHQAVINNVKYLQSQ